MKNLLIIGGGDFLIEIINYIKDISKFSKFKLNILGIVDSKKINKKNVEKIYGKKINHYSNLKNAKFYPKNTFGIITIGNPIKRENCRKELKKKGFKLFTLIHPKSYVSAPSKIGEGCIVAPFSFIGPETKLEENILVCIYATVGHHSYVGKSSVVSPYSSLIGKAKCGRISFMGTNSTIIGAQAKLGSDSKLTAGSVLYKKTGNRCLVAGNPAIETPNYSLIYKKSKK